MELAGHALFWHKRDRKTRDVSQCYLIALCNSPTEMKKKKKKKKKERKKKSKTARIVM